MGKDNKPVSTRFEPNCKICQYSKEEEGSKKKKVYDLLEREAAKGAPYGRIEHEVKKFAIEIGVDPSEKTPSRKSIWNHFEKHISIKDFAKIQAARSSWEPEDSQPLMDIAAVEAVTKENFDEYAELCKLYVKFREISNKIYEYDHSLKMNSKDGIPNEQWSMNKIQTFTSMINTQKAILSEISKMRQGDKLVSIASKFIIEEFTKNIIYKLKSEFDSFAAIMKRSGVNDDIVDAFQEMSTYRVTQLFTDEAGSAMELTKKEFKLPN